MQTRTHLVDIVGINTITTLFGCLFDPLFHHIPDMCLALLVVNVNIPLVPLAQPVLKSFGTGAHSCLFVGGNTGSAVAFGFEA
jgi:hypothetical protein